MQQMTIIFRSNQPSIDKFIAGKLSADLEKFPIRESMFKNSNYLDIWNQLTEYYERVREKYNRICFLLYIRRIFWFWMATSLQRIQLQFCKTWRGSLKFPLSSPIRALHIMVSKKLVHVTPLLQKNFSVTLLFVDRKGFPCFKLDDNSLERCMGLNKGRKHPDISSNSRNYLRKIFKPMLKEFNRKTGMNIRLS